MVKESPKKAAKKAAKYPAKHSAKNSAKKPNRAKSKQVAAGSLSLLPESVLPESAAAVGLDGKGDKGDRGDRGDKSDKGDKSVEDWNLDQLFSRQSYEEASPLIYQFLKLKEQHREEILFYRVGEFYEMFFGDAQRASLMLDLKLTERGRHLGRPVPLCGVPVRSAKLHLEKLVELGARVAVCDQLSEQQQENLKDGVNRGNKGQVMGREVSRIITAGTLVDSEMLDARHANYMAAISDSGSKQLAIAWVEASLGELKVHTIEKAAMNDFLKQLEVSEILLLRAQANERSSSDRVKKMFEQDLLGKVTLLDKHYFDKRSGSERLNASLGVSSIDAFGKFSSAEQIAMGAIVTYLMTTQVSSQVSILPPEKHDGSAYLSVDTSSRRNLEFYGRKNSLLGLLDHSVTAAGARCLESFLANPLRDIATLNRRLDFVERFVINADERAFVRTRLIGMGDPQRALTRLAGRVPSPRDMWIVFGALRAANKIREDKFGEDKSEGTLLASLKALDDLQGIYARLEEALVPDPPRDISEGGIIRSSFDARLKSLRQTEAGQSRELGALEARYANATGIRQLKIKHFTLLGLAIEVPQSSADKMGDQFVHRQSTQNQARFISQELLDLSTRIEEANKSVRLIEKQLFYELLTVTLAKKTQLIDLFNALARLDAFCALAELAARRGYCRPVLSDKPKISIKQGRHPTVEAGRKFTPNDLELDDKGGLVLLTGPNMAGKSTFLRQVAIITVMAQMGSFVPASKATIGVADKIMCRIGAYDEIAEGRSTFLVEMIETAAILNQATEKSLVIIDELGRGTATHDGLAIARASSEYLLDRVKCRALFATHFHELSELAKLYPAVTLLRMEVKKKGDEILFLHSVGKGVSQRSYGIDVAKLAGVPPEVIKRATEILTQLESTKHVV